MKKTLSRITVLILALVMVITSALAVYADTENGQALSEGESAGISAGSLQDDSEEGTAPDNGQTVGEQEGTEQPVEGDDPQPQPATYTVKWMNQGGTGAPLEVDENAEEGSLPAYNGTAPSKASDGRYNYTFAGWSLKSNQETGTPADKLPAVTDNVTYYAAFSKKEIPHVHSYGAWVTTVYPTYLAEGTMVRTCACGATETQSIPKVAAYNTWISDGGSLYYLDSYSNPVRGWVKMKPYKSKKVKWCYFTQDGVYVKSINKNTRNKWVNAGGYRFYFTKKRKPAGYGFNYIRKKLYHMNSFGAVMYGTFTASDGNTYTTAGNGTIKGTAYYKYKYKSFVLIDISEQTIWFYKNGAVKLKSDVVTGTRGRTNTPTGTFKIRSKKKNINLVGPTWNSHVNYWMAFKGSSYGLHDASWRTSKQFSNHKTYLTNGSHGCVNLRPDVAASLYGMVRKGTPVIIQQ